MKDVMFELYGEQWTSEDVSRATREVTDCMHALATIQQNMDHSSNLFRELFKHEMQTTLTRGGYTSGDTTVESKIMTWNDLGPKMQQCINDLYKAIEYLDFGCADNDLFYPLS